jgi:Zn-dependent protease
MLSILPGGIIFGWAKPVPYNPYNLRNRRWGELIVAIAGPLSNFLLAFVFGMIIRFGGGLSEAFIQLSLVIVVINIVLGIFNLMPIPPLDGSKILFSILPQKNNGIRLALEKYGFMILIFFIFFLWQFLFPVIAFLVKLFTGISF